MNKRAIFIFAIILVVILFFSIKYKNNYDNKISEIEKSSKSNIIIETSTGNEKTTPNTILTLKKEYMGCGHIITNKVSMSEDMVNLTKEELLKKYKDWNLDKFTKEEIILSKKFEGVCGEQFVLKEEDGYISVYAVDENNNETLKEKTNISTKFLTETDKIALRNKIRVNGLDNLHKILEDFEG